MNTGPVQVPAGAAAEAAPRLVQLDALRGLAALAVVLFHFSTRFQEVYGAAAGTPLLSVPWGHHGVSLFFMISGFVIVMTLERTRTAMDFVVSRTSRLYPAYWGAVLLTFCLTHLLGLPGRTADGPTLLWNLSMLQGFFGQPLVDGVYWTLEVELLFYAWALLWHRLGGVAGLRGFLLTCLGLKLAYAAALGLWQLDLPWVGQRWLLLPHVAWFALGMAVYRLQRAGHSRTDGLLLALALCTLAASDGPAQALLGAAFSLLLQGAARGRWTWLEHPALLWLGGVSYALYLVHQYVGWALMLQLQARGVEPGLALLAALLVALLLAQALTQGLERPAMRWWRERYRQRHTPRGRPPVAKQFRG